MRGRLIFPFQAEVCRFAGSWAQDPDFHEPRRRPGADGDGTDFGRTELPPVQVPCQVEMETAESLRMFAAGDAPQTRLHLVFHMQDLEARGLVADGEVLIRPRDRLA